MDNINTNTMVGKVVAVCIALLFIVVLAFPVANSLSNGGNGGDDSAPITYTNEGIPFARADADTDEHTVVVELVDGRITVVTDGTPIDIGLGEPLSDYDSSLHIEDTIITTDNGVINVDKGGSIGYMEYDGENGPGWIDIGYIYYDEEYPEGYVPATFTIHNGTVTFNEMGDGEVPGEEYSLGCKLYLSSDGDYVRGENVRVLSDSLIYVDEIYLTPPDISVEYHYMDVIAHGTSTILDWDNVSVRVSTQNSLYLTPALIVNSVDDGAYYTLQNVICPIEFDYFNNEHISTTYTLNGVYVPKTISYSEDTGSDSPIGGVASTLIKLVPILLIVSLLLVFIVPMVYKPN